MSPRRQRIFRWLLLGGFCLTIFGGKLWLVDVAGSDLPTWDQWDAEGEVVLRPWLEGWLRPKEIFHPHNEHRVIVTKLFALGLFGLNGQWDGFVETVAAGAVHTLAALILLQFGRRWLSGGWLVAYGALLVLLCTLPFSWENSIFGFQSSFYFLLVFALGHIGLTLQRDDFNARWALGQVAGILGLCTLASGFFSAVAIILVLLHRLVRERRWTAQQITTVVLGVALIIAGWLMKNDVPGHAYLRAKSAGQFGIAFFQLLAWPGSAAFPWSIILFVPAVVFIARVVRARATSTDDAVQLGLIAWVLLQCLATSYARGGSESVLSPRYLDLLSLNVALGLVFLFREFPKRRAMIGMLWLAAVLAGLAQQTRMMWRDFVEPNISRQHRQEDNVRDFLRTGDPAHLLNKPWGDVPYPVGDVLVQRLAPPVIQAVMPPSVRRSVPVADRAANAVPPALPDAVRPVALSTWSQANSPGRVEWRSATQPASTLPVLRFRVAGDLGRPDFDAHVWVKSAAGEAAVIPETAPGNTWKTVNVFRPPGEWWLQVSAATGPAWFAFTEPVEVGRWRWATEKMLKHHFIVLAGGLVLLLAGAVPHLRRPTV